MAHVDPRRPLIEGVSQHDVDFVIPRVGIDLPIGIDPFLLYKSRDLVFSVLHTEILSVFNYGIHAIQTGNIAVAEDVFRFPEVSEIGMGYTQKSKRGSGIGTFLSQLIVETLVDSPALCERGVKHIEEMQLVSLGIGPDRISDISANLLKYFLIDYTQKQCALWNITTTSGVPVTHIFDYETYSWYDGYFDLPISSVNGTPMLFVPRRLVRVLPWINYEDFFRMEFSAYLRAKQVRQKLARTKPHQSLDLKLHKQDVVTLTRTEVDRIERYVSAKEAAASDAQPSITYIDDETTRPEAETLIHKLSEIRPGTEQASVFQRTVLEILNFLFNPQLINGELEVRTLDGTERRDIIFTNDSDQSFWEYLRIEHSAILLMFETKNTSQLENAHVNQTATYLGDRLGRLGFIVTRYKIEASQLKKIYSVYNDSQPRKIILVLSDSDLQTMITMKCEGKDPMRYIQKLYRTFRTNAQ